MVLRVFGVVMAVLIFAVLLWIGGELHYQSCVESAYAEAEGAYYNRSAPEAPLAQAAEGCSRLPF